MCFWCSKEPSHRDGSFEYPQHMFWLRNKKSNFRLPTLIWGPVYCFFFLLLGNFCMLFDVCFFFQNQHFWDTIRVWIQIRTNILLDLIWVQTVCKGDQQMTKIAAGWQKVIVIQDSLAYFINSRPSQHELLELLSAHQRKAFQWYFNHNKSASILNYPSVTSWGNYGKQNEEMKI